MNASDAVARLLGRPAVEARPLGGAYRVRLADGTEVVAKRHAEASAVRAEVAGLHWLRAASGPPRSRSLRSEPSGTAGVATATDNSGARKPAADDPIGRTPSERAFGAPGGPPRSRSLRSEPSGAATLPASTDDSGALASGYPQVPAVLGFDDQWLVVELVPVGRPSLAAAEELGRELAALHRAGASAFGSAPPGGPVDAWIGLAPMRNVTGESWPEWYAEHRVLPYLRAAVDQGVLHDPAPIEAVCGRIDRLAGTGEPPARLHGDLWSGNVLWAGRAWLIDPAAHGGHRETDLAMLRLFGCPHLERIIGAYHEAAPLADGWRDRVSLHQLFPLLVHTVLFGGGYGAQAVAAARSLA